MTLKSTLSSLALLLAGLFACCAIAFQTSNALAAETKPSPVVPRIAPVRPPEAGGAVEPSVAIDPTNPEHLIAVSIQGRQPAFPGVTNFAYVSTDAGRTWKTAPYPNPQKRRQGDDMVTFAADGLALRTYIAFDGIRVARPPRASTGILVSTSRDGLIWSDPVAVVDHLNSVTPYEDKPWLKVDNSPDSPHRGNVYVAWTRFDVYGSKNPEHKSYIYFSRSRDHGKTFSVPWRISEVPGDAVDSSKTVMGAVPAVGPKGEVYVVWGGPLGLVLARSTDGGWTFAKNQVLAPPTTGWDFEVKGLARCNGLPSCGVDVSPGKDRGSVYACWADKRNGDPDIFFLASRDGGATWGEPLRVNDDPRGNGKDQFFPCMAVDPVDGSVNIAFYDRRDCEATQTRLTLARSTDGGRTFINHPLGQEPFACERGGFFGDYFGIDARGGRVALVYMHYLADKKLALSSAVFDFTPGTQLPRGPDRPPAP